MCGRYSLAIDDFSELRLGVSLALFGEPWTRRYNIAPSKGPGHEVPIVRVSKGQVVVKRARWWLIPHWWTKPLAELPTTFNARAEELENKPMWREPLRRGRCLVPVTGWREFVGAAGAKRSYYFHQKEPFVFAGLYDKVRTQQGVVESFAIITAEASERVAPIHDRMPLPLPTDLHERWLFDPSAAQTVLKEAIARREEQVELFEVSSYGNSVHNEGPECIAPVTAQFDLFTPRSHGAR